MAQTGMDDEGVVAALKARDPAGIEAMVERYGTRLLRSATLLCGNETAAHDLVQDVFVAALRSIHRFRGQANVYTWLHSILLNLTRHYHRASRRLVYDHDLDGQELPVFEEPPCALDSERAATELARALSRLSAAHREVLVLRYYERLKLDELARHLGISKGTVKSRLHYALLEMQKLLPSEMNLFGLSGTNERP
jgi:RNA polymerase sigma-70 factor, ECF subfamily